MSTENKISIGPAGDVQELSAIGRLFQRRRIEGLFREERASSGKLRRDVISRKEGFLLSYETADQEIVDRAKVLYDYDGELTLEINHLDRATETFQVLIQPYSEQRLLAIWGGLWEGVTLEFLEV